MSAAGYEPGTVARMFTEGVDSSQRWRNNRQREEVNDIIIRGAKDAEGAHRMEMGERSLETSEWGLKNPWLDRFFSFAKGRGAGKMTRPPKGSVSVEEIPQDGAAYGEDLGGGGYGDEAFGGMYGGEEPMYADGGRPRSALRGYADGEEIDSDEAKKRAAANRAKTKGKVGHSTQPIEGADRSGRSTGRGAAANDFVSGKNIDRARNVMEPDGTVRGPSKGARAANWGRRALNGYTAKAGAIGALGATAYDVANTPTEDYRERFGMELGPDEDATFAGDVGVRTLGAASDLGNNMTLGLAGRSFRDRQGASAPAPAPRGGAAPATPAATPAAAGGGAARGGSMAAGGRKALSSNSQPEDTVDVSEIAMSDVGPESIPDFRTRDWSDFREKALDGLVARGMPLAQAAEEVDNQTMRMQQKGFNHFAMQGAALIRAGNTRGAMAAIKAAYQMFPSGDDVKLGVRNGQIFGITIDEETGKPTGQPIAITPESILSLVDQANKPGSWREHAKDARDFQFTVKKYLESERPLAEATGSAMLTRASADMMNANSNANESAAKADYYRMGGSGGGSGGGGVGSTDFRNAENVYRRRLEMMQTQNPQEADRLGMEMSELKRRNPGAPDNLIIKHVMERAGYGGPEE